MPTWFRAEVMSPRPLARGRTRRTRAPGARGARLCFTSNDPGADAARLARDQDVLLALVPCPASLLADGIVPPEIATALEEAPCDVALLAGRERPLIGTVVVPFGAAEYDWAAVELGAWVAEATRSPLRLVGSESNARGRDASRTLATASLLLQRHLGIAAQPALAEPGPAGMVTAVADAALAVVGMPESCGREGSALLGFRCSGTRPRGGAGAAWRASGRPRPAGSRHAVHLVARAVGVPEGRAQQQSAALGRPPEC